MITALRLLSLITGIVLVGSVPFFLFWFAAGVGDLDNQPISTFLDPLWYTIPMGAGNLLIGTPSLVSGERSPVFRFLAGILLVVSFSITLFASIAFWPFLICVVLQVTLFAIFVWPASPFKLANPALQRDAAR